MTSPHKSKRKTDTFKQSRSNSPMQAPQVDMEDQSQPQRFSASSFANPFASKPVQPFYPKQFVSLDTFMRHTGSKDELHY